MQTGRKAVKQSVDIPGTSIRSTKRRDFLSVIRKASRARAQLSMYQSLSDFRLALRFSASVFSISSSCDHGRRDNWTVNPAFDILIHEIAWKVPVFYLFAMFANREDPRLE